MYTLHEKVESLVEIEKPIIYLFYAFDILVIQS